MPSRPGRHPRSQRLLRRQLRCRLPSNLRVDQRHIGPSPGDGHRGPAARPARHPEHTSASSAPALPHGRHWRAGWSALASMPEGSFLRRSFQLIGEPGHRPHPIGPPTTPVRGPAARSASQRPRPSRARYRLAIAVLPRIPTAAAPRQAPERSLFGPGAQPRAHWICAIARRQLPAVAKSPAWGTCI